MEILIFNTHRRLSAIISPFKFTQRHSSEGCLFTSEKTCDVVLEANKKQVPLKSYSLEIRIDPVNQILKNKEKVIQTRNISIQTRIADWKIQCVCNHVYQVIKKLRNWSV